MAESIDYTIRVSRRARRPRIVVRPNLSVEVVLPQGVAKHYAATLLEKQRRWVARSLKRFGERAGERDELTCGDFPKEIMLTAIDLRLVVCYRKSGVSHVRISESENELTLTGCIHDAERVRSALQRWLKQKAKESLPAMLERLSEQYGYRYRKATIRLQKSRWGSCSRVGNISLNAKLLFLPAHLVHYVMLHELAHLKHLNHSPRFWAEVARSDPDYQAHVSEMRTVHSFVPDWVES